MTAATTTAKALPVVTPAAATAPYWRWMEAMKLAKSLIGRRTTLPVLASALVEPVEPGRFRVIAFDLEQTVVTDISVGSCTGPMLVPAVALHDTLVKMRGLLSARKAADEAIRVEAIADQVIVTGFGRRLVLERMGYVDDYPAPFKRIDANKRPIPARKQGLNGPVLGKLDAELFRAAWTNAGLAAGRDDTLPQLTGLHLRFDEQSDQLTIAATDRYRLHVLQLPITRYIEVDCVDVLVPARFGRLLTTMTGQLTLRIDERKNPKHFIVSNGTVDAAARLLEGNFPKYQSLIPDGDSVHWWEVDRHELIADVKVAMVTLDRNAPVVVDLREDSTVQVKGCPERQATFGGDLEKWQQEWPLGWHCAFNPKYLLDVLGGFAGARVRLGGTSQNKPFLIDGDLGHDHLTGQHLLMPVRLPA